MTTSLDRCANGCDAPPAFPRITLCNRCLDRLKERMCAIAVSVEEYKRVLAEQAKEKP